MSFFVLKCKGCGRWKVKEVKKIQSAMFRCFYCNKTFKIKLKNQLGLALVFAGPYDSGAIASEVCKKLNEKKIKVL